MHHDKSLSDNITFTVIDDENRYFEYHIDDDRVFIFNRFDSDDGEEIFGDKADEIRTFAKNELAKLTQSPREIKPGAIVKYFKGGIYQVICVSTHTETKEKLVTYTPFNDNISAINHTEIWTRPYDMFMSKVDTIKYPNASQQYRLEIIGYGNTSLSRDELNNAIELGLNNQQTMLIEEMSELTQALCKYTRKTSNGAITPLSLSEIQDNIIEELADVDLVINQVKYLLDNELPDKDVYAKIQHIKSVKTQRYIDRKSNQ